MFVVVVRIDRLGRQGKGSPCRTNPHGPAPRRRDHRRGAPALPNGAGRRKRRQLRAGPGRASTGRTPAQACRSSRRISAVTARILFRSRGRLLALTASLSAPFSGGAPKAPVRPRQRVRIDQEVSRRWAVPGVRSVGPQQALGTQSDLDPRRQAMGRILGARCTHDQTCNHCFLISSRLCAPLQ